MFTVTDFLRPALYLLMDSDGAIVYVGQSVRPLARITDHVAGKTPWIDAQVVASAQVLPAPADEYERKSEEYRLILKYRPRFNRKPAEPHVVEQRALLRAELNTQRDQHRAEVAAANRALRLEHGVGPTGALPKHLRPLLQCAAA